MKTLITGSSGYIGSHLAELVAEQGHQVLALVRDKSPKSEFKHSNITKVIGDVTDFDSMLKLTKGCDYVYHLAAVCKVWVEDQSIYEKVNIQGSKNVFEACYRNGVKRVVSVSTAGTIGPQEDEKLVNEDTPRQVEFFNEYERTKYEAEKIALEYVKKGLEIVIVNPTRVFGPGIMADSNSGTRLIERYVFKKWRFVPGDGNSMGNYIYVDDLIRGMLLAMQKGKSGERYLLGGENASWSELIWLISLKSGIKREMVHVPLSGIITMAKIMNWLAQLMNIEPALTPPWAKRYLYNWGVDTSKARKELGLQTIPLESAIEKTVNWLKEQHELKEKQTGNYRSW